MSRKSNTQRSKESYDRNKIKVARQRILNAIDKGKCVWKKTLYDPKYNWTNPEKAMLIQCLNNRRNRYLIDPKKISFIRDKRYKNIYPSDNYKAYYYEQKKHLDFLENKLNKLKKFLEKVENEDVKLVLSSEINHIENQILDNPLESSTKNKFENNRKLPFRSPSPSPVRSNQMPTMLSPPRPQRPQQPSPNVTPPSPPQRPQSSPNVSLRPLAPIHRPTASATNTPTPLYDIEPVTESFISIDHVKQAYNYMIDNDLMYENRLELTKSKGKKDYENAIDKLFFRMFNHKHKTANLLNVYKNPEKFSDMTHDNKMFLQILYKLYTISSKGKFPVNVIPKSIVKLSSHVDNIQMFVEQFSLIHNKAKEAEEHRMRTAPYYDWDEVKKIPSLVKGRSMQELKDLIIMNMYINENIIRDNLGMLKVLPQKPSIKINFNYIFKNESDRYEIILNDYKNSNLRGSFRIKLHSDTSKLIDEYIDKKKQSLVRKNQTLEYLLTKDDNTPYKDGKLSKYIIRMFERYTEAKNLGINELRHSVATHYKDESNEFKTKLAYKMQHSLAQHLKYERHSKKIIKIPAFNNMSDEQIQ